jgi:hypothetical protein
MHAARGWFSLAGLAFSLSGCLTSAMQYPGIDVTSKRVAAMPSEGVVWDCDFYGKETVAAEDTLKAKQNIDDSINYRVRRAGGRSFGPASVGLLDGAQAFRSWAVDTLSEIMLERIEPSARKHATVGDFRFPNDLESWRSLLDADFVLFTTFILGRETMGRALAVGSPTPAQRAIACVVHLHSRRVVWCQFDDLMSNNLLVREGAQKEVDRLIGEMLLKGQTVASEPPPARATSARVMPAADVPAAPPSLPPPPGPEVPLPAHFHAEPSPNNAGPS